MKNLLPHLVLLVTTQSALAAPPLHKDRPPIATDDLVKVEPGGHTNILVGGGISVLANDFDPDGDMLTSTMVTFPMYGGAIVKPDGTFIYDNTDPTATEDYFIYQACDGKGLCGQAMVRIAISM